MENKKEYDMSEEILDDDFWLDEEDDEDILYGTADDIEEKVRRDSGQPGYVKEDPNVFSEERPYEAMSRREKKIYKQRMKQEAQLAKIRAQEEAEREKQLEKERKLAEKEAEKERKRQEKLEKKRKKKEKKQKPVKSSKQNSTAKAASSKTAVSKGSGKSKPAKTSKKENRMSAQDSIRFKEMGKDGICRVQGKTYSKTIRFYDINYQLAQNEDKNAIFEKLV